MAITETWCASISAAACGSCASAVIYRLLLEKVFLGCRVRYVGRSVRERLIRAAFAGSACQMISPALWTSP